MHSLSPKDMDNDHKREAILELVRNGLIDKYDLIEWLLVMISDGDLDECYGEYFDHDEDEEDDDDCDD